MSITGYQLFRAIFNDSKMRKSIDLFREVRPTEIWTWRCSNPDAIDDIMIEYSKHCKYGESNLDWRALCGNYAADEIIIQQYYKERSQQFNPPKLSRSMSDQSAKSKTTSLVFWKYLSGNQNPSIIPLIEERIKAEECGMRSAHSDYNLDWRRMSANPTLWGIMQRHPEKIDLQRVCGNPAAIDFIAEEWYNPTGKIERWEMICSNPAPGAIPIIVEMFYKCPESLNWDYLTTNLSLSELVFAQLEEDHRRESEGKVGRIAIDALCENPLMLDLIVAQREKDPNSVYWNKVCQYNFMPYAPVHSDAKYDAKALIRAYNKAIDVRDTDEEIDEFRKMVEFELNVHRRICTLYGCSSETTSDRLLPVIKKDLDKAKEVLGDNPIPKYILSKMQRARIAHQAEFWDGYTTHSEELDAYRELKYFEFLKHVLIEQFKGLHTYCSSADLFAVITKNKQKFYSIINNNRDLLWALDVQNPVAQFRRLQVRRNRIAHSRE